MKPGESPQETVSRALKEEFRLRLSKKELNKRLGFVCINSSTFSLREQPPRKNGRQNLIVVFSLDIKEEERKQFTVSQGSKYKKMKWFAVSETNIQGLNPIIGATISRLAEVCT
jgi:ADP-ribose pyrophosphatase YjhB (NUDIX family)